MTEPAGSAPTAPSQTASTVTDQETGPGVAKPTSSAAAPGSKEDWTDQVTALIVDTIDKVRNRTTGPILEITRGSVHAIVALTLVLPVLVLLTILAVRVLTYYVFREVWITYTVLGMILTIVGVVLWSRRDSSATNA